MAVQRSKRPPVLVFVAPPLLALLAAKYAVDHHAPDPGPSAADGAQRGKDRAGGTRDPESSGRISGRVLDPEGNGAPHVAVWLVTEEWLEATSPAARSCGRDSGTDLFAPECEHTAEVVTEILEAGGLEVRPSRVVETNARGEFELDALPADRYALFAQVPGAPLALARDVASEGERARHVLLSAPPRVTLGGVVLAPDGHPIPDVAISAIDPRLGRAYSTVTDRHGNFALAALDAQVGYYVLARAPGLAPRGEAGVSPDEADLALDLEEASTIVGQVMRNGHPVGGIEIEVDALLTRHTSDSSGTFRVEGLVPGFHTVRAKAGLGLGKRVEIEVPSGVTRTVELALEPVCDLSVRVVDDAGAPTPDADVRVLAEDSLNHRAVRASRVGIAELELMTVGSYQLDARHPGVGRASVPLSVPAGCSHRTETVVLLSEIPGRLAPRR